MFKKNYCLLAEGQSTSPENMHFHCWIIRQKIQKAQQQERELATTLGSEIYKVDALIKHCMEINSILGINFQGTTPHFMQTEHVLSAGTEAFLEQNSKVFDPAFLEAVNAAVLSIFSSTYNQNAYLQEVISSPKLDEKELIDIMAISIQKSSYLEKVCLLIPNSIWKLQQAGTDDLCQNSSSGIEQSYVNLLTKVCMETVQIAPEYDFLPIEKISLAKLAKRIIIQIKYKINNETLSLLLIN